MNPRAQSSTCEDDLQAEIERIRALQIDQLRTLWRSTFGLAAPPALTKDLIARMRARSLAMICANPDVVVERGDQLVYCAGAIADAYAAAGGDVVFAGKPYRPIYEQALALAEATRGKRAEHHRVLAIGDSVRTDVKGAAAFGIDCLFVIAGIHAEELGGRTDPDAAALAGIFAAAGVIPKAVMRHLSW